MADYYILAGLFVLALAGGLYLKRQARRYRDAHPRRCCSCCDCPCHARERGDDAQGSAVELSPRDMERFVAALESPSPLNDRFAAALLRNLKDAERKAGGG